ncbi:hypothetical protein VP01_3451g2 [Puccinia sorghi]|uniref:Uncharacterized protein n=1 Tax=Puccinia sorghi TaxID=27349 RepID=A0A0L6UW69_9BASI|nr:hypothetical protein VP01_3451g2 [Puccinia sorghi]
MLNDTQPAHFQLLIISSGLLQPSRSHLVICVNTRWFPSKGLLNPLGLISCCVLTLAGFPQKKFAAPIASIWNVLTSPAKYLPCPSKASLPEILQVLPCGRATGPPRSVTQRLSLPPGEAACVFLILMLNRTTFELYIVSLRTGPLFYTGRLSEQLDHLKKEAKEGRSLLTGTSSYSPPLLWSPSALFRTGLGTCAPVTCWVMSCNWPSFKELSLLPTDSSFVFSRDLFVRLRTELAICPSHRNRPTEQRTVSFWWINFILRSSCHLFDFSAMSFPPSQNLWFLCTDTIRSGSLDVLRPQGCWIPVVPSAVIRGQKCLSSFRAPSRCLPRDDAASPNSTASLRAPIVYLGPVCCRLLIPQCSAVIRPFLSSFITATAPSRFITTSTYPHTPGLKHCYQPFSTSECLANGPFFSIKNMNDSMINISNLKRFLYSDHLNGKSTYQVYENLLIIFKFKYHIFFSRKLFPNISGIQNDLLPFFVMSISSYNKSSMSSILIEGNCIWNKFQIKVVIPLGFSSLFEKLFDKNNKSVILLAQIMINSLPEPFICRGGFKSSSIPTCCCDWGNPWQVPEGGTRS